MATRKKIDPEILCKLAERQWTVPEIAAFFGVSRDTIERRFAEKVTQSRHNGAAKLRDLQWKKAIQGDSRMIIHMSKHYLGQRDNSTVEVVRTAEPEDDITDDEGELLKLARSGP